MLFISCMTHHILSYKDPKKKKIEITTSNTKYTKLCTRNRKKKGHKTISNADLQR